jgi:type I restriction enzyme M protein
MPTRIKRAVRERSQLLLYPSPQNANGGQNLPELFRGLYYNLYTNSKASRAERIIEDLSLLLLLKLAAEANGQAKLLARYLEGKDSANDLIPVLRRTYPGLVSSNQRFSLGEESLREALLRLQSVRLSDAPAHVLGDAFQALIGPRLRGDKGQFFTPRAVVRAMVQVLAPEPHDSVLDPACGTGGFLLEAHCYQASRRAPGQVLGSLVGVDKDHDLFRLCSALLQIASGGRASIRNFNSLDSRQWDAHVTAAELFDVVLTNPPFGARIGVRDRAILQAFSLGHRWVSRRAGPGWLETQTVLMSQDPQLLFLELCISKLKPGGRLGIVLPEGVFGNKQDGYVWEWVRMQGEVIALLDCPRTTFQPGTDTKTNILFFRKHPAKAKPARAANSRVHVAVALNCGHDRRGRAYLSNGQPHPDDFSAIGAAFHDPDQYSLYWRPVQIDNGDYLVPRYYMEQRPLNKQEEELTRGAPYASLGDLVHRGLISVRKGHEVGSDAYGTGSVPFVRTSDVSNFEISTDPSKSVSEEVYSRFAKQQSLRPGDVLMVVDGRYRIGATALVTGNNYRCIVQSHFRIISCLQPECLGAHELLFALNLPSVRLRIRNLVFVQSTLGTLGKRLLELRVPILHGPGPWQEAAQNFRAVLVQRDGLLSQIRSLDAAGYEL